MKFFLFNRFVFTVLFIAFIFVPSYSLVLDTKTQEITKEVSMKKGQEKEFFIEYANFGDTEARGSRGSIRIILKGNKLQYTQNSFKESFASENKVCIKDNLISKNGEDYLIFYTPRSSQTISSPCGGQIGNQVINLSIPPSKSDPGFVFEDTSTWDSAKTGKLSFKATLKDNISENNGETIDSPIKAIITFGEQTENLSIDIKVQDNQDNTCTNNSTNYPDCNNSDDDSNTDNSDSNDDNGDEKKDSSETEDSEVCGNGSTNYPECDNNKTTVTTGGIISFSSFSALIIGLFLYIYSKKSKLISNKSKN